MRAITSYAKVQGLVGFLIRNRAFQLRGKRTEDLRYLNIGCGRNTYERFINIDYLWHPGVDVCWDLARGLPFATGSMTGVFTEHCLEHFDLPVAYELLRECRRVLKPGGVLRIVVPDGGRYLDLYQRWTSGDGSAQFPYQGNDSFVGLFSPILSVNRVYYQDRESPSGHRCMFDFALLAVLLDRLGFETVRKADFRQGCDPGLLIDSESRQSESLYVEGIAGIPAA